MLSTQQQQHFPLTFRPRTFSETERPYWKKQPLDRAHDWHDCRSLSLGDTVGDVVNDDAMFGLSLDVSHFRPKELNVDLDGRELTIKGLHTEKTVQFGTIERSFTRRYLLPPGCHSHLIRIHLSDEGLLCVECPKMADNVTNLQGNEKPNDMKPNDALGVDL